jgi:hypothetical protein
MIMIMIVLYHNDDLLHRMILVVKDASHIIFNLCHKKLLGFKCWQNQCQNLYCF